MPRGLSVSCAAKSEMVTKFSDIVKSQLNCFGRGC
ncbi:hypothetical protein SOVF_006720 [Spinacia oleracea]|nr:hypothetical protein SOVF_006720 [Spinacia oleracea]